MLEVIIPSIISSLVVGFGAAWLASQKALAVFEQRLTAVETAIARFEEHDRKASEKLIRLETKMDLLLERLIPPPSLP